MSAAPGHTRLLRPEKLLFLPGASGDIRFWQPVADLLTCPAAKVHLGWPGFGPTPPDSRVHGIEDLATRVIVEIHGPTALIAQSMGGVIALLAAMTKPECITHLVLTATSGGMDMASFGAQDWRPAFIAANPSFPPWFATYRHDLTPRLPSLAMPTLLLWGDADPISPVEVGRRLATLLPHAALHIVPGGDHLLANSMAPAVAPLIDTHLAQTA